MIKPKYKAWDKSNKIMREVSYINFDKEIVYCKLIELEELGIGLEFDFADIVLIQYAGLKDDNGVEIYEGYKIKNCDGKIYVVSFDRGGFGCDREITINYLTREKCTSHEPLINYVLDGCEVVGNIYEGSKEQEENE